MSNVQRCPYCGRYMAFTDYGADYGTEWVCSQQVEHIVADPERWSVWVEDGTYLSEWGVCVEGHIPAHTMTEREIRSCASTRYCVLSE